MPAPRTPPYASELLGVYQPLIGWTSGFQLQRAQEFHLAYLRWLFSKTPLPNMPTGLAKGIPSDVSRSRVFKRVSDHLNRSEPMKAGIDRSIIDRELKQALKGLRSPTRREGEREAAAFLAELGKHHELTARVFRPTALMSRPFNPGDFLPPDRGVLSPVGVVNLFRQYFFDAGTFEGPPVGHVWVSPYTTLELVESNTRRQVTSRTDETTFESTNKMERALTASEDLADVVRSENQMDIKFGAGASGGWHVLVADVSGSVNFDLQNLHKEARETTHKRSRQQTERLSNEIRRSFKTSFQSVLETTTTNSRRYVLQNQTSAIVNYELCRKMRRVVVQLRHIGTQLCWQVFIDNPGSQLGIAELVHIAKKSDATESPPAPEKPAIPKAQTAPYVINFPFAPIDAGAGPSDVYEYDPNSAVLVAKGSNKRIKATLEFTTTPPEQGLELTAFNMRSCLNGDPSRFPAKATFAPPSIDAANSKVTLQLQSVDFEDCPHLVIEGDFIFSPSKKTIDDAKAAHDANIAKYTEGDIRRAKEAFVSAARERIRLASEVRQRPPEDLREEERTTVYHRLIGRLVKNSPNDLHLTSELVRSIFEVDKLLYFVAPDWWKPRADATQQLVGDLSEDDAKKSTIGTAEVVGWGGVGDKERANYLITDDSQPAPLGASLGWLLQLDGDARRNAFLNSPWVKAVIPIRPGREKDAIDWLARSQVEGSEGLDAKIGSKTVRESLLDLAGHIENLSKSESAFLEPERVFESGFEPNPGGFRVSEKDAEATFTVFDQWSEVVPTDQLVAVPYTPKKR